MIHKLNENDISATTTLLAEQYHSTVANIMHKLDPLIQDGYIIRTVSIIDKRLKYYSVTKKGEEIVSRLVTNLKQVISRYLNFLGDDVSNLINIFEKTIKFMEDENV